MNKNDFVYNGLKTLFCGSFGEPDASFDEIVGFAAKHGGIKYIEEDGKIVSMLCLAELEDGIKYLFAVATSPEYRNRGLFAKNLSGAVTDHDDIVCIPENETLFALYEKIGFSQTGYVLQSETEGNGLLLDNTVGIDSLKELYSIYKSSSFYPKKQEELFYSTIRSHFLYGGSAVCDGSFYALTGSGGNKSRIFELCVPEGNEYRISELIRSCTKGKTAVRLSAAYERILIKGNIPYYKNRLFALRSRKLNADNLYINILYN